jgi:hypothetical protein
MPIQLFINHLFLLKFIAFQECGVYVYYNIYETNLGCVEIMVLDWRT